MAYVSVVIPFHNRIGWVVAAVASVLSQTYMDFELILVDDGSTDAESELLSLTDPRIRLIRQENRGPGAARNLGLGLAKGHYVAFLDSDDLFLPNKLESQVEFMDRNPSIPLSHTSYQRMRSDGTDLEVVHSGAFSGRVFPRILVRCPIATPTVMMRRDILTEFPGFVEHVRVAEDVIMWTRLAREVPLLGLDQPLTKVRMHGRNAATKPLSRLIGRYNVLRSLCTRTAPFLMSDES